MTLELFRLEFDITISAFIICSALSSMIRILSVCTVTC